VEHGLLGKATRAHQRAQGVNFQNIRINLGYGSLNDMFCVELNKQGSNCGVAPSS